MKQFNNLTFLILILISLVSCDNKKKENKNTSIDYSKAKECYDKGVEKMSYNDYRGAVLDFEKARKIDPNYFDAFIKAGKCEENLGNNVSAGQNYSSAIRIDSNSGYAYYLRGMNLIKMPGGTESACYDFSKSAEFGYSKAKGAIQRYCN